MGGNFEMPRIICRPLGMRIILGNFVINLCFFYAWGVLANYLRGDFDYKKNLLGLFGPIDIKRRKNVIMGNGINIPFFHKLWGICGWETSGEY